MGVLVKKINEDASPIGEVKSFSGSSLPTGKWLFCDGSAYNSVTNTEYAALYAIILNTYGGSDGTDFQVPDLRAEFLRGLDNMGGPNGARSIDTGRGLGTGQAHDLLPHNHTINHDHASVTSSNQSVSHTHLTARLGINNGGYVVSGSAGAGQVGIVDGQTGNQSTSHTHTTNLPNYTGSSGNAGTTETRPRNVAIKYIIKY